MNLPKNLKIGGKIYTVKFPYTFKERNDLNGQCDTATDEIRIGNDDGNGNKRTNANIYITLIHEILHAIDYDTGHYVFKENEFAIEGFSHSIYQVLIDNGFLKGLTHEPTNDKK